MWVRSQDKKILMECKKIEITNNNIIVGFNGNFETLGIYSTKEKALNVLNKIERFATDLERCIIEHDMFNEHATRKVVDNIVFQMPQDKEVEE